MTNKYLNSLSKKASSDGLKDVAHTGTIGAMGFGTSYLASRLVNGAEHSGNKKAALVGGALGLAGDYAAVKLNKHIDKGMDKLASNRFLEKIAKNEVSHHTSGMPGSKAVLDVDSSGHVNHVHNQGSPVFEAADKAKHMNPNVKKVGFGLNKYVGLGILGVAATGAAGYGAKKLYDKAHVKKANVQHLRGYSKNNAPITDKKLAGINTAIHTSSKLIGGPIGIGAKIGAHAAGGRSFNGALREEGRGAITGTAKGIGYGIGAAGIGAGIGAIAGKFAGNQRVAKVGANIIAKVADIAHSRSPHIAPNGKRFLDDIAGHHPEKVKAILQDKHLGIKGGAAIGAGAGLITGGTVGSTKGQYDGRLASIRNQIREGNLKNVTLTKQGK